MALFGARRPEHPLRRRIDGTAAASSPGPSSTPLPATTDAVLIRVSDSLAARLRHQRPAAHQHGHPVSRPVLGQPVCPRRLPGRLSPRPSVRRLRSRRALMLARRCQRLSDRRSNHPRRSIPRRQPVRRRRPGLERLVVAKRQARRSPAWPKSPSAPRTTTSSSTASPSCAPAATSTATRAASWLSPPTSAAAPSRNSPSSAKSACGLEWQPACFWKFSLGYTWFYWSDVARAIDQIDTTVDIDQLAPTLGAGGRPAFRPANHQLLGPGPHCRLHLPVLSQNSAL